MPDYVAIKVGRRKKDFGFMQDFQEKRGMVKVNMALVQGVIALEEVPTTSNGVQPAMVLTAKGWNEIYCVTPRYHWDDNDYFNYAKERFRDLGIEHP